MSLPRVQRIEQTPGPHIVGLERKGLYITFARRGFVAFGREHLALQNQRAHRLWVELEIQIEKPQRRIELMSEVWGHSSAVISLTVDTHIAELRRKLEVDPARPRHIVTVRKSGYRLDMGSS